MIFSVICLTYKRNELLEECIYSVINQTLKDWELIIVNDCYTENIIYNHPQIKLFNLKEKFKTIGDKRNFGISNAKGDLIIQLDDDDFLLPNYLQTIYNTIGNYDWLSAQRPILYNKDSNSIILSPVPQFNTFVYKRKSVSNLIKYESKNYDELTPFYRSVTRHPKFSGLFKQLGSHECGYVYRQEKNKLRKYIMSSFKTESIEHQETILSLLNSNKGNINLSPNWKEDYTSIIKQKMIILPNSKNPYLLKANQMIEEAKKESMTWNKVKPNWENALKFVNAIKSRGILSTAISVIGVNNTLGERVSNEILEKRKISCFGNKNLNAPICSRLKFINNKGYFCGSCGCGDNNLARLDGDFDEEYTKLHYPYLQCPLQKPGFSNEKSQKSSLSIIINVLNDNEELNLTIKSIRETSPSSVEIIVIDDYSDIPVVLEDKNVKLTRLNERKGVGITRWIGAQMATSDYLLFIDSHMRFDPKWYDNAIQHLMNNPWNVVWCAVCLGLEEGNMDIQNHKGAYNGARLSLYEESTNQVFEGKWIEEKTGDDYEISCLMGACYFFHKSWFMYIKGTASLKMWGSDEPLLSLKTLLAGGEIRLMKSVKIGHKFRPSSPYATSIKYIIYNKLRSMRMLLPPELYQKLSSKIPEDINKILAVEMMNSDVNEIDKEKEYYQSIFTKDINWLSEKFNIKLL